VAETAVARTRSLMTFQAEALAAAMRANKSFWQSSTAYTQSISFPAGAANAFTGGTGMTAPGTGTCVSTSSCTAGNLAYDDLTTWKTAFSTRFPAATGTIVCTGSATTPETCDITLNWTERTVAINTTTAAGTSTANANLVLHVQP
jgi:type IV pilus assembly protein PilV